MMNYIIADLIRICRKKIFLLALLGFVALYFLMIFILNNPTFKADDFIEKTETFVDFMPLFYGLPIFMSVFYDDFKSKTMQVAIGYGFSRIRVILCKLLESVVITFVVSAVMFGITWGTSAVIGFSLSNPQVLELFAEFSALTMKIIGYIFMSAILVYATQKAVSGVVVYILLASQTVMLLFNLVLKQDFIVSTFGDLSQYLYSPALFLMKGSVLEDGVFPTRHIITVVLYLIVSVATSILVFRKKELEF